MKQKLSQRNFSGSKAPQNDSHSDLRDCVLSSLSPVVLAAGLMLALGTSPALADSYTSTSATTAWGTSRWNNTSEATPYTSAFTANNAVSFTSGNYTFATGMASGNTVNVGNVTLSANVNVAFTGTVAGTFATGGAVRTLNIGTGAIFDLAAQNISTASGTGFIKNGDGILSFAGNSYNGGFTLNAGTVILRGVSALGNAALTINGGTIAANATRNVTLRYTSVTIGGNFTLGGVTTGVASGDATTGANITFADSMGLGAATRTITIGANGTYTLGGILSSATATTGLTVAAASGATGKITLTGANTYTGTTTVSGGTLELGSGGAVASSGAISITGGTLLLSGTSANKLKNTATVSVGGAVATKISLSGAVIEATGALTLASGAATRVIDFGTTSGVLTFNTIASAASGVALQIWNWSGRTGTGGGTDQFIVGSLGSNTALGDISFYSNGGTTLIPGATVLTSGGELVPIPEVGALFGMLGLMAPLAYRERRHFLRCREARA